MDAAEVDMGRKIVCIGLGLVLLAGILAGCGAPAQQGEGAKLRVVASIFPVYDFARAVAGGLAQVEMLIAPGASIHAYDPSPADIRTLHQADLFLYIGGESDVWADRLLASLEPSGRAALRLMDCVRPLREERKDGMQGGAGDGGYDEHIWTSPKNAVLLVEAICGAMCEADPGNAAAYRDNAAAYQAQLEQLDGEITELIAHAKRKMIVVADRFPFLYFVRDYGLDYAAAFPGCSEESDADPGTLLYLIQTAKRERVPYIYYVELSNPGLAEMVAKQAGAGVLPLHSCHNVTREAFDKGVTYVSLMGQNIGNLRKGLY